MLNRRLIRALACCGAALAVLGCPGGNPGNPAPPPILLLALDGFEPRVVLDLVRQGRLPHFERAMRNGTYGLLETKRPTLSPILWTTIATGKPRRMHGIHGFLLDEGEETRLYRSSDRRTSAFWEILSRRGRRVAVVGWWLTHPVEPVEGVMVAQVNSLNEDDPTRRVSMIKGRLQADASHQIHPPERAEELLAIDADVRRRLPEITKAIYGPLDDELQGPEARLWSQTHWSIRSDTAYAEIAEHLAAEPFDLLAVYLGATDVAGHRFWRYTYPDEYAHPPGSDAMATMGEILPRTYEQADRVLGRLLERMPRPPRVLVVSDHGMEAIREQDVFDTSEDVAAGRLLSGHHLSGPPGLLIASGPDVPPIGIDPRAATENRLPTIGSILDVTPTILAWFGIEVGADMIGRPMSRLVPSWDGATVPTWDDADWRAKRRRERRGEIARPDEEERREQLRALGYID